MTNAVNISPSVTGKSSPDHLRHSDPMGRPNAAPRPGHQDSPGLIMSQRGQRPAGQPPQYRQLRPHRRLRQEYAPRDAPAHGNSTCRGCTLRQCMWRLHPPPHGERQHSPGSWASLWLSPPETQKETQCTP
jgi:hypothetical protein